MEDDEAGFQAQERRHSGFAMVCEGSMMIKMAQYSASSGNEYCEYLQEELLGPKNARSTILSTFRARMGQMVKCLEKGTFPQSAGTEQWRLGRTFPTVPMCALRKPERMLQHSHTQLSAFTLPQ